MIVTVPVAVDEDGGRRADVDGSWSLIEDHGDAMTVRLGPDAVADRVTAIEQVLQDKDLIGAGDVDDAQAAAARAEPVETEPVKPAKRT